MDHLIDWLMTSSLLYKEAILLAVVLIVAGLGATIVIRPRARRSRDVQMNHEDLPSGKSHDLTIDRIRRNARESAPPASSAGPSPEQPAGSAARTGDGSVRIEDNADHGKPPPVDRKAIPPDLALPGNVRVRPPAPAEAAKHFHLRFEGDACDGSALIRGRDVRLIFGQDFSGTAQSISFHGTKFDSALAGSKAKLLISLTAGKGIDVSSLDLAVARFENAELVGEVGFDLQVNEDCPDTVTFSVEFFAGGTRLYALTFDKTIVSAKSSHSDTGIPIIQAISLDVPDELEATLDQDPRGTLIWKLSCMDQGPLRMSLFHTRPDLPVHILDAQVTGLDASGLQAQLGLVRGELGANFYVSHAWDEPDPAHVDDVARADLEACLERVASAGAILFNALGRGTEARNMLAYIDAQPEGTRLTIATSGVHLPFEIIYSRPFNCDWPEDQKHASPVVRTVFWGARFAMEVLHVGNGDYCSRSRVHRDAPRAVSLNLNNSISAAASVTPASIHATLARELAERGISCDLNDCCDKIKPVLLQAKTSANLIYVYCHGSAANPQAGNPEELHIDADCLVRPVSLVPTLKYVSAPILILNSCYGGAASPLFYTGFHKAFCEQGALGLIATCFPVPVMFGARFGGDIIRAWLNGDESLGERIRRLRCSYLGQGNPVPLFYSVQCQISS